MGHDRRHRGAHPEDTTLFAVSQFDKLRLALHDYCWLLSRGYAGPSSLKLVGDRYHLFKRQRLVLMRSACTDAQHRRRERTRCPTSQLVGCDVYLDGFNVLIAIESALSGGYLFVGQDGCYRDLSGVHGTYKKVQETQDAIRLIGETLFALQVRKTFWFLDQPVSNSGRLRQLLVDISQNNQWDWQIELCKSPDFELSDISEVVVSTDSAILDSAAAWCNLNRQIVDGRIPDAELIDLRICDRDAETLATDSIDR